MHKTRIKKINVLRVFYTKIKLKMFCVLVCEFTYVQIQFAVNIYIKQHKNYCFFN